MLCLLGTGSLTPTRVCEGLGLGFNWETKCGGVCQLWKMCVALESLITFRGFSVRIKLSFLVEKLMMWCQRTKTLLTFVKF